MSSLKEQFTVCTDGIDEAHNFSNNAPQDIHVSQRLESPIQESARLLYEMGMNVLPLVYGKKKPCMSWERFHTSRLHLTHEKYGLHAVFTGQCNIAVLTGKASDNLAVIDAETMEAFEWHIEQCKAHGIPLFTSLTGNGGHIWLRTAEGEANCISPGVMHDCEFRSGNGYIVAPPSLHPTGVFYEWHIQETASPPVVSIHDIDWFVDSDGNPIALELRPHTSRKRSTLSEKPIYIPLSRRSQEYLWNGGTFPKGIRNLSAFSTACDFNGNGISEEEARDKIVPIAKASGLPSDEAHQIIKNAYSRPREPARKNRPIRLKWQLAAAFLFTNKWKGRTGSTDRAVMLAFVERARLGGNENGTFRASYRELADAARCSVTTVQNAIKRLKSAEAAPFICYAGLDKISKATIWRFSDYVISQGKESISFLQLDNHSYQHCIDINNLFSGTLLRNKIGLSNSVPIDINSDALERGALGKTGMLVYQTMLAVGKPLTTKEIAEYSGLTINQVRRALSGVKRGDKHNGGWLSKSGIVNRQGRRWIAYKASDEELDERIANPAGKLGAGEKRKKTFARERAINLGRYVLSTRMKYDRRGLWGDDKQ